MLDDDGDPRIHPVASRRRASPLPCRAPRRRLAVLPHLRSRGHLIPRRLGDLGVDEASRLTHIGWDQGALGVALRLSALLDATLVAQLYSRLVIDSNRVLGCESSIPLRSERTEIPGNLELETSAARARARDPRALPREIARLLDQRARGRQRHRAARGPQLHAGLRRRAAAVARRALDRRLPAARRRHAVGAARGARAGRRRQRALLGRRRRLRRSGARRRRGLPRALLEISNDRIETEAGQAEWAARLARVLRGVRLP
jgi:hypothetical protein